MASVPTAGAPSHYVALDAEAEQIRVLDITPGGETDIVKCAIRTMSLVQDLPQSYETISYCWGPPKEPTYNKLNGHLLPVPPSSEAAIKRMRLQDRLCTLWIDAVCIDQESLAECSRQVALMASIYWNASMNLVYLGEDDGFAQAGMNASSYLVSDMHAATDELRTLRETLYDVNTGASHYYREMSAIGLIPWRMSDDPGSVFT